MKKFPFLILIVCFAGIKLFGQQQVIASGGGFYTKNSGSISWTLGEPVIQSYSNSNGSISQGFQQGNIQIVPEATEENTSLDIAAFPNPTTEAVTLRLNNAGTENLTVILHDLQGREIYSVKMNSEIQRIDLSACPQGIYFLIVIDSDKKAMSTFKIIKQ
jgi:hypothetical protein